MRHWRRTWRDAVDGRLALLAVGIAAFGMWSEHVAVGAADWRSWLPDAAVGTALLVSGTVAQPRGARVGFLLIATSVSWWLGNVVSEALYLHRGLLLATIWTYPATRAGRHGTPLAAVVGAVVSVPALARSDLGTIWFGAVVLVGSVVRLVVANRGRRRLRRIALQSATVVAAGAVGAVLLRAGQLLDSRLATTWYQVGIAVGGVVLAVGVLRHPTVEIANAVVELGTDPRPPLRDRLADLLDDPDLVVARRSSGHWVDERGTPVIVSGDRVVTVLPGGELALVNDVATALDAALLDALESVTRLAARNAELESARQTVLDDLVASGRRLRDAELAERARLSSRLHGGVGRRLDAVGTHLATAAASVSEPDVADAIRRATEQLEQTRADLLAISHGLQPEGHRTLADSLSTLVAGLPVPTELHLPHRDAPDLGTDISSTLSYCCSEALANAVKHARAGRIVVELSIESSNVVLTVTDDGIGGADTAAGSGLRGLRDRARAVGGTLHVDSTRGTGTRIVIAVPHRTMRLVTASEAPA